MVPKLAWCCAIEIPGVLSILGEACKYYNRCLSMSMSMEFHKPSIGDVTRNLELAEKFLAEGGELIDKDPVQASEKLYKAAEEAVKALAKLFNLPRLGRLRSSEGGQLNCCLRLLAPWLRGSVRMFVTGGILHGFYM